MKKTSFTVRKCIVRMLVTVGGVLGFSSCQHGGGNASTNANGSQESNSSKVVGSASESMDVSDVSEIEPVLVVYGPPRDDINGVEPVEIEPEPDVYGPPVVVDPVEPVDIVPEQ